MKKEVTYYLEDISRLNEISQSELDSWIAELPFHQPLQMLAGIKSEMAGHQTDKAHKVYSAYFAEDFEMINENQKNKNNQRNKKTKQLAKTIDINTENDNVMPIANLEKKTKPAPEIAHSLADDILEDTVNKEVLEEFDNEIAEDDVSSDSTDVESEEQTPPEDLEENLNIQSTLDSIDDQEHKVVSAIKEENESDIEAKTLVSQESTSELSESKLNEDRQASKVDYSEYSGLISKKDKKAKKLTFVTDETLAYIIDTTESIQEDSLDEMEVLPEESTLVDKKTKNPKKAKKKKDKSVDKNKKKNEDRSKHKELKKANSRDKKNQKKKSKVINLIGKAQKRRRDKKTAKRNPQKEDKNIEYVIIDSPKNSKFKLNDYEGVSSYTSWLLKQESINDVNNEVDKITQVEMKKKKSKISKKKKQSKSLKIAVDSIKKQDSIISEPLADILAAQGHKKKARKMYTKLAHVLPEKKAYFEEKIESLKK